MPVFHDTRAAHRAFLAGGGRYRSVATPTKAEIEAMLEPSHSDVIASAHPGGSPDIHHQNRANSGPR